MNRASSFLSDIRYAAYVMFHPFKGFWDLKHMKIGKPSRATLFIVLLAVVTVLRLQWTGYILNSHDVLETNLLYAVLGVVLPVLIWVLSNWGITTLVDGEGSFRDIYVTTAYALTPYILISLILVAVSQVLILEEASLFYLLEAVALLWTGLLLLIGMMTIHQFSMGKTLLTVLIALVGMVVILFVCLLFFALIQQVVNFIILIVYEVTE